VWSVVFRSPRATQVNANAPLLDFYPVEGMELRASLPQIHAQEFIQALAEGQRLVAQTLETVPPLSMTLERIAGQADARGVEALFTLDQPVAGLRVGNLLAISVPKPAQRKQRRRCPTVHCMATIRYMHWSMVVFRVSRYGA